MTVPTPGTRLEILWGRVLWAFAVLNGVIVLCLAVMITSDVLVRWATGRPFVGVFEISRVLFVPVIFMVLGLVQWTDRQVRVDALVGRATGRMAVGVRAIDQLFALAFFLILLWTASESWLEALRGRYIGMGMLEIPHVIPIGFLTVGVALTVVTLLLLFVRSFRQLLWGIGEEAIGPPSPMPRLEE